MAKCCHHGEDTNSVANKVDSIVCVHNTFTKIGLNPVLKASEQAPCYYCGAG